MKYRTWTLRFLFVMPISVVHCILVSKATVNVTKKNNNRDHPTCETYDRFNAMEGNLTETCNLTFNERDINNFVKLFRAQNFMISLLRIKLDFPGPVNQTECTISYLDWVWTIPGQNGGTQYLHIMYGYEIYSVGLLNAYTISMKFRVELHGNCQINIGERNTTGRIAFAFFEALNNALNTERDSYIRQGYLCYLSGFKIHGDSFNKYFIVNQQTFGYRCCHNTFDERNIDEINCRSDEFLIDNALWWNFSFYVGWFLFLYSPFVLLKLFTIEERNNKFTNDAGKWIACNPISWSKMLNNIIEKILNAGIYSSKCIRIFCASLTFSLVAIEIALHKWFLNDFTVSAVKATALFDWKSMAAGYQLSRHNFLEVFGGPYIALGIYLSTFSFLLCLPQDISLFINTGLEDDRGLFTTLLTVDVTTRGRFGAVLNIHRITGYRKLYAVLKANIYMLINPAFWRFGIHLQIRRFQGYLSLCSRNNKCMKLCFVVILTPVCILFCSIEWLLVVIMYGFPIISFFSVLSRSCYKTLRTTFRYNSNFKRAIRYTLIPLVILCLLFDFYIFSLIVINSCVFMCRVFTYSFTGLIAYPQITYSYAVFAITVIIYITESIQNIGYVYSKLFDDLKRTCLTRKTSTSNTAIELTRKDGVFVSISKNLFRYTVRYYRPLRIELLFSFLKICFIVIILYMCISNLLEFHEISRMPALTQAVTALFICLVPKLWHMFANKNNQLQDENRLRELEYVVDNYCQSRLYSFQRQKNIQSSGHHVNINENNDVRNTVNDNSYEDELMNELLLDVEIEQ